MEPTPLKLLVGVIFASILIGVFIGLKGGFERGRSEAQFLQKAEDLSELVQSLGDPGSQEFFSITVPENSQLRFRGENVVAVINNMYHEYECGVSVTGGSFGPGSYSLKLTRVEGGVEINVQ